MRRRSHPDVTIEIEQRPGGGEGDNIVKTRLATGEMTDVFLYNSGSLLQALKPEQHAGRTSATYRRRQKSTTASSPWSRADGKVYGVPFGTAMAGGILYNRKIYQNLGLPVPKSWAEFMANNEKIKAAGKVAVAQTYRDTWTSQLFVLADYYNLHAQPRRTSRPTTRPTRRNTRRRLPPSKASSACEEVHDAGLLNEDFGASNL